MPIHYQTGDDHIVRITIDRPEARNSLDMEHFAQLEWPGTASETTTVPGWQ